MIDWSVVGAYLADKVPWFLSIVIAIVIYEMAKKAAKVAVRKAVEHKAKTGFYIAAAASICLAVYFGLKLAGWIP